jgi:phage/plasmid-like protein (TIGR03299 family)
MTAEAVPETMAYVYESEHSVPWHTLGNAVIKKPGEIVSAELMTERAGIGWTVSKDNLRTKTRNTPVPGKVALIRDSDGAFLDIVGSNWKPIQNSVAAEFYRKFCEKGDMELHTAGSLDGGRIVWFLAKLKTGFTLPGGDHIEGHLLFMNPHSFARSAVIEFTPIRVVCMNTLILALNNATKGMKVTVSHKTEFDPEIVERALGLSEDRMKKYEEAARFLASKRCKVKQAEEYFNQLFPVIRYNSKKTVADEIVTMDDVLEMGRGQNPRMRSVSKNTDRLHELLETQPGAEMSEGTWWQPYNAITYLTDHEFGRTADSRIKSAWTGANRRLKLRALNLALEMAA